MARLPRTVVPGHPHHVTQRSNRRVKYPVPNGTDRFGRVDDQRWYDYDASEDRDRFAYGYDRNSNRTWRENTVAAGLQTPVHLDEAYVYDHLDRLTEAHRGNLDANDEIPAANRDYGEAWGLTPTGNWQDYQIDHDGDGDYTDASDLDQDRTHNDVNEIWNATPADAITEGQGQTAWESPLHDARDNTTTIPQPLDLTAAYSATYDAWNRLVEVKDGSNVVLKCEYDGLGRRTKKFVNTSDPLDQTFDAYRHFYYSAAWQILETRRSESENDPPESESPEVQYVWSRRYIDAAVLRDRDADADSETGDLGATDSGLDQRLYYTTDANMNVTALLDTGGDAVERYVYNPYGEVTIYDDDWSDTRSASSYANAILYCGYFFDSETGLYHVRWRVYHPTLGRWLQRDPLGYVDGMGLYEYVATSPVASRDPTGLFIPGCSGPPKPSRSAQIKKAVGEAISHLAPSGYDYVSVFGVDDFVKKLQSVAGKISYGEKEYGDDKVASFQPWGDTLYLKKGEADRQSIPLIENSVHEMIHAYDHINDITDDNEGAEALAYTGAHLATSLSPARFLEDTIEGRVEAESPCKYIKSSWKGLWAKVQNYGAVVIRWKEWGFSQDPRSPTDHDVERVCTHLGLCIKCSKIVDVYNKRMTEKLIRDDEDPSKCCTLKCPLGLKAPFK